MLCVKALSMIIKKIAAIAFPGYGSLYFLDAPIKLHLKLKLADGFCLGPYCGATYWNCNTDEAKIYSDSNHNRRPYKSILFSFRPTSSLIIEAYKYII